MTRFIKVIPLPDFSYSSGVWFLARFTLIVSVSSSPPLASVFSRERANLQFTMSFGRFACWLVHCSSVSWSGRFHLVNDHNPFCSFNVEGMVPIAYAQISSPEVCVSSREATNNCGRTSTASPHRTCYRKKRKWKVDVKKTMYLNLDYKKTFYADSSAFILVKHCLDKIDK